jgi:uncharacterized protein (TIGR03437 family)
MEHIANLPRLRLWKIALATLCAATFSHPGLAQAPPPTILRIDTGNAVVYFEDTGDVSRYGTDPGLTTPSISTRVFIHQFGIADIQAVNGQPAMGLHTRVGKGIYSSPAPPPGNAIADAGRAASLEIRFEILKSDGTPIGTIVASGLFAGASPPGSPSGTAANFVVTGGTGAFLGARGQMGAVPPSAVVSGAPTQRNASITENPANRRLNGGGAQQWVVHLIPMERPEIIIGPAGPAITHSSDFSVVSTSKPAAAGEILSLFASGLGPVKPGVDPGQPFPSSPPANVNSPIEVSVNGKAAEVLSAVGYPGAVDGYQVNFRVPPDTAKGLASIQVSAAWIAGSQVSFPVQ